MFLVVDKGWCDSSVVATLTDAPPSEAPDFEGAARIVAVEGGYYPGFAEETDPAGLSEVIHQAAGDGNGWVKLVGDWPRKGRGALPNFEPEHLKTVVEVSHAAGVRVAIHTMAPEVASWAVAAGVDSIEHGLFLTPEDLEALADRAGGWVPTILRCEALIEALGAESSGGKLLAAGLENVASRSRGPGRGRCLGGNRPRRPFGRRRTGSDRSDSPRPGPAPSSRCRVYHRLLLHPTAGRVRRRRPGRCRVLRSRSVRGPVGARAASCGTASRGEGPVTKSVVLASSSPRRAELLGLLGIPFEVQAADVARPVVPARSLGPTSSGWPVPKPQPWPATTRSPLARTRSWSTGGRCWESRSTPPKRERCSSACPATRIR